MKAWLVAAFLFLVLLHFPQNITFANVPLEKFVRQNQQTYWRTELFFGRDKNDGTQVSDEEWNKFLDEFVTPRFPDGLTVFDANGQYRLSNGTIAKEGSKVMILLYKPKTRLQNSRKIEQIRREYKSRFKQESVMRIDFTQRIRVSF